MPFMHISRDASGSPIAVTTYEGDLQAGDRTAPPRPGALYVLHLSTVDTQNADGTYGAWVFDNAKALDAIRAKRDELMAACDYTVLSDTPITAASKSAFLTYRQALRDFPATCDPANPQWPTEPTYVKA